MSNTKNYLFLLTISPVQSFIAQARKTQDLYAGSRILSELVKVGMNEFNFDNDIIFPKSKGNSLPNRFIAKFTGTPDEARKKGEDVKKVIQKKWKSIADTTLIGTSYADGFNEQIKQHLDIHWAFEEIKEEEDNYKKAYKNIESLIGAIKNVRPFEQYSYNGIGEQGRKCSIDGQNNALFFGYDTKPSLYGADSKWNPNAVLLEDDVAKVIPNEGLSAISFVKRFYEPEEEEFKNFPSTAEIALMQEEKSIPLDKQELLKCYKDLFDNRNKFARACLQFISTNDIERLNISEINTEKHWLKRFDHQLLYEENLVSKYIPNVTQLKVADLIYPKLKSYFKQKYYALILFDGDKMGKWLSGENLKGDFKAKNLQAFHIKFSELLSKFGGQATKYVNQKNHNGQTIYAGGDDYLGFVNLECLFEVMAKLRTDFYQTVGKVLIDENYTNENITFSAGIVVASYKMPLSEVLKKAREVEKIAKNKADRNAFAISVMKSSGEIQQATFKWGKDETGGENSSNWEHVKIITNFLRDEKFSNKFISSLSTELYQLAGTELNSVNKSFPILKQAIETEIKRLVKRAKSKETNLEDLEKMEKSVIALWKESKLTSSVKQVENFIHVLHIADFLHRKLNKNYQQHEN